MPESRSHKRGKGSAAKTEVPISRGRRLDAKRGDNAIEVERSGTARGLKQAISRLKTQRNSSKILRVPEKDMRKAADISRQEKVNLTVTNLSKTKRRKP